MASWIIPCNPKFYDVEGAFSHLRKVNWKQSRSIDVGDDVYIYVGSPIKAILFRCCATKVNLPRVEIDDSAFVKHGEVFERYGNYMELELKQSFLHEQLTLDRLQAAGMKGNVQGPRQVTPDLQHLLAVEEETIFSSKEMMRDEYGRRL